MLGKRMMAMCRTSIASRDPQGQEVMRQAGVAFDRANLGKEGCQRVIERGGELQAGIIKILEELALPPRFANEERASSYTYPPEYGGSRPIEKQIRELAEILGLDPTSALGYANNLPKLPNGAEGWFAIPSVDALAVKHFPTVTDPAEKYCRAVRLALGKLGESREFYNYRDGQVTPAHLNRTARTADSLEQVAEMQENSEILVVAAQLGLRHRGRSVRRAREVFVSDEFGLGSLEGSSIVMTHPEWLVRWEQLHMDCAGDEYEAVGWSRAPCFNFSGGRVSFGTDWVDLPCEYYGSASGFLPQVVS